MRCPNCGAETSVLQTRKYMELFLRRARICFNDHRFFTLEVPPSMVDSRSLKLAVHGLKTRRKVAHQRIAAVKRAPHTPAAVLAEQLGISDARVRQIRAKL